MSTNREEAPMSVLGRLLRESGASVQIGLKAQGHIPTVEGMLDDYKSWDEIGKAIGWNPEAAKDWYIAYLRRELAEVRTPPKVGDDPLTTTIDAEAFERIAEAAMLAVVIVDGWEGSQSSALLEDGCVLPTRKFKAQFRQHLRGLGITVSDTPL